MKYTDNIFYQITTHGTDGKWEPGKKCEPTMVNPGSAERIKIMAARVMAGQELFHVDDGIQVSDS